MEFSDFPRMTQPEYSRAGVGQATWLRVQAWDHSREVLIALSRTGEQEEPKPVPCAKQQDGEGNGIGQD